MKKKHVVSFSQSFFPPHPLTGLKLCPGDPQSDWARERYTFEGHVAVALNKSNYERCMTQIYKELNIVQRQFRVQFHVPIKHQKYHRFAFKRIFYQLHGKSTLLAVRSIDTMDNHLESPHQDTYDKPWKQRKRGETKLLQKPSSPLSVKQEDQGSGAAAGAPSRGTPTMKRQSSEGTLLPSQTQPDSEPATQQSNASPDAIKRALKPLIPNDSIIQEIPLSSTPILSELAARVASHLGAVFKKQVSHLVLDFVKNSADEYVLIDILGFQFSGYGPDIERSNGTTGRVLALSPELQYKIEHFYRCRLNGTKFHSSHHHEREERQRDRSGGGLGEDLSDDEETDSDEDSTLSHADYLSHVTATQGQGDQMKASQAITPQTLTCRMCTRKIAPGSIRYLLTSVMLHSTVVHLRSRLAPEDLPEFCRDRSLTMKSMQRLDDLSTSASLAAKKKLDVTESDLVTCEHCYALYRSESKLMEVEHKLAKFTRIAATDSLKFDHRKKISKPLLSQQQRQEQQIEITTAPLHPPPQKRQSVSGANILTRPLSAPALSSISASASAAPQTSAFASPVPSLAGRAPLPKGTAAAVGATATPSRGYLSKTSSLSSFGSETSFQQQLPPPTAHSSSQPLLLHTASRSSKESHLRDTFRAKNSPNRTHSKDFYHTVSPLQRAHSLQQGQGQGQGQRQRQRQESKEGRRKEKKSLSESQRKRGGGGVEQSNRSDNNGNGNSSSGGKEYPPVSSIPIGRQVTRADVMSQPMTLCRMMVAIHKVSNLPPLSLSLSPSPYLLSLP
jgi:hypothetical protein